MTDVLEVDTPEQHLMLVVCEIVAELQLNVHLSHIRHSMEIEGLTWMCLLTKFNPDVAFRASEVPSKVPFSPWTAKWIVPGILGEIEMWRLNCLLQIGTSPSPVHISCNIIVQRIRSGVLGIATQGTLSPVRVFRHAFLQMRPGAPCIASLRFEARDIKVGVAGCSIKTRVYVGGIVEDFQRILLRGDNIFES